MRILGFRLLIEAISYLRRLDRIDFGSRADRAGRSGAVDCPRHTKATKQESAFILARNNGRSSLSVSTKHNGFCFSPQERSRREDSGDL
jgi:hypothetical protein